MGDYSKLSQLTGVTGNHNYLSKGIHALSASNEKKNRRTVRSKRSPEVPPDSIIEDYFTEDSINSDSELDESEEDARMIQINELLAMIESQEKAGGEHCEPGTELLLGENIVDSYGKVSFISRWQVCSSEQRFPVRNVQNILPLCPYKGRAI